MSMITQEIQDIKTKSLVTTIFNQLEKMIFSGELKSGDRINESKLASELGVSRAPVREACRRLEKFGIAEVRPNQGTFIPEVKVEDIIELYDIRASLDSLGGELAAVRITQEQLEKLINIVSEMKKAVEKKEHIEYFNFNLLFHDLIMVSSGSRNLKNVYDSVCKKSRLFRQTSISIPERLEISMSHHDKILKAIKERNPEQAGKLLKEHTLDARNALVRSLK